MPGLVTACRDFAIAYVLAIAGAIVISQLLIMAGLSPGGFLSAVPLIAAAFYSGGRHGERTGEMPASALSWRIAIAGTLIALAISLVALAIMVTIFGEEARAEVMEVTREPGLVAIVTGILLLVHVGGIRLAFPIAARSAIGSKRKRQNR